MALIGPEYSPPPNYPGAAAVIQISSVHGNLYAHRPNGNHRNTNGTQRALIDVLTTLAKQWYLLTEPQRLGWDMAALGAPWALTAKRLYGCWTYPGNDSGLPRNVFPTPSPIRPQLSNATLTPNGPQLTFAADVTNTELLEGITIFAATETPTFQRLAELQAIVLRKPQDHIEVTFRPRSTAPMYYTAFAWNKDSGAGDPTDPIHHPIT